MLGLKSEVETRRPADSGERAYLTIRQSLVEFKLKPEERINEVHLARSLGISRTPIREALNRLASEGFLTLVPNRGFFCRALDVDGLLDIYEFRAVVECGAFTLMCQRASDEALGRLDAYWHEARERYAHRDPDEILGLDEGFHLLIAELSGNPEIERTLSSINARIRFIRRVQIEHVSHNQGMIEAHSLIVEAALARDIAKGTTCLRQHIELTVAATKQALKDALLKLYTANQDTTRPPRSRQKASEKTER